MGYDVTGRERFASRIIKFINFGLRNFLPFPLSTLHRRHLFFRARTGWPPGLIEMRHQILTVLALVVARAASSLFGSLLPALENPGWSPRKVRPEVVYYGRIRGEPSGGVVNCPSDNKVFDHAGERRRRLAFSIMEEGEK